MHRLAACGGDLHALLLYCLLAGHLKRQKLARKGADAGANSSPPLHLLESCVVEGPDLNHVLISIPRAAREHGNHVHVCA